jgi:hypothetical protein
VAARKPQYIHFGSVSSMSVTASSRAKDDYSDALDIAQRRLLHRRARGVMDR